MKLVDDKGKLFGKINIVDLVVIISCIVLVGGIVFRSVSGKGINEEAFEAAENIQYVVKIAGVRDFGMLVVGDEIFDNNSSLSIGHIIDVEKEAAVSRIAMDDGTQVLGATLDTFDIYLTIEVEGEVNETGKYAHSTFQILNGTRKAMHTKFSSFTGTIVDML